MKCVGLFMAVVFLDDTEVVDNNGPENQQDDQQQGDEHGDETSSSEEEYHSAPEVSDHEDEEAHGARGYTHAAERRPEPEGREEYPVTEEEKVVSHHSLHDETELNRPMDDLSLAGGGDPVGAWAHTRVIEPRPLQPQVQREREYKPMESEPEYEKLSGTSSTDSPTAPSTSAASPSPISASAASHAAPSTYSATELSPPCGIGARPKNTFRQPVESQEPPAILTHCSNALRLGSMSSNESNVTSPTAMSEELLNKQSDRSLSSIPEPGTTSDITPDATPEGTPAKPEATYNVIPEGAPNDTPEASGELSEFLQKARRDEDTCSFSEQDSEEKDKCEKDLPKIKKNDVSFIKIITTAASNMDLEERIEPVLVHSSPMSRPASEGSLYSPASSQYTRPSSLDSPHRHPAQQRALRAHEYKPGNQQHAATRARGQVVLESRTPGHKNRVDQRVSQPNDRAFLKTFYQFAQTFATQSNLSSGSGASGDGQGTGVGGRQTLGASGQPAAMGAEGHTTTIYVRQLRHSVLQSLEIALGPDQNQAKKNWRNIAERKNVCTFKLDYLANSYPQTKVQEMFKLKEFYNYTRLELILHLIECDRQDILDYMRKEHGEEW